MANDYINQITTTDGTTWDIKDTVSGYTTNTGTVTGMTTTAGTHTAGAQTVSSGIITTNIPTKTSHLTNDSGFLTSSSTLDATKLSGTIPSDCYSDVNVTSIPVTGASTYYLTGSSSSATATGGLNKHSAISAYVAANTSTSGASYITIGNSTASGTAGSKYGSLRLYGGTAYYTELRNYSTTIPTANRTCYLPRYAGTQYLTCVSTTSAVGGSSQATYVNNTGQIVAGNSFVPTTGGTFSGAVTAAASDGTTAQIVNVKYGSAAPSGTATNGTVYFQTGSSAYTFQSRVNLNNRSASTTLSEWTHFTLPVGLYLITFQVNCGSIRAYNLRVDLIAGSNTITQIRTGNGSDATGMILDGAGLVECTSSTTIYFKAQTSSDSVSNCELHYSYVKLF